MKIYLKEEDNKKYIYFEKRLYSLRCELEKNYHPELVQIINEDGIEVDENEDIRKYIFDYCIRNSIHEYYAEIVGDNYLFDVGDATEKVEAFVEDLLDSDESDILDNDDYKYVDYRMEIDVDSVSDQIVYVPTLILKFETFSLSNPLIIGTAQDYHFDLIEKAQAFCEDVVQLYDLKSTKQLDYDYYRWYE